MTTCNNYEYSHDDGVCQNQAKWMSNLKDTITLNKLSIPGTHDSMSLGFGGDIAQTQSKSLQNQLVSGIRFLDIRLAAYPNLSDFLYAYHGFINLNSTFSQILDIVTNFLKDNPSETILMRLKQEYTDESDTIFISLLQKLLGNSKYSNYVYKYSWNNNPILRDLRGKIVVLQNFGGPVNWMLYINLNIQDNYNLNSNWDLYGKWEKVKAQLNNANMSFSSVNSQSFMNYLSGSGGVFPYFVASGHSSHQTNASRLWTGLTEPTFKNYYPDFPRTNRIGIFASIEFEGTNILTRNYIENNGLSYVGIVVADFPGQRLINTVINVNLR